MQYVHKYKLGSAMFMRAGESWKQTTHDAHHMNRLKQFLWKVPNRFYYWIECLKCHVLILCNVHTSHCAHSLWARCIHTRSVKCVVCTLCRVPWTAQQHFAPRIFAKSNVFCVLSTSWQCAVAPAHSLTRICNRHSMLYAICAQI